MAKRFASIDIGSNGMRLLIVEASRAGSYRRLHQQRAAVRLGHHTFTQGRLDPQVVEAAIVALHEFKDHMETFEVSDYRCVATAAVREAKDGMAFQKRVRAELGLKLRIIDGGEEARLVHRSMQADMDKEPWLIMDLGGGSLELTVADAKHIHWSQTRPIGTVRLLEKYADTDLTTLSQRLHEHVEGFEILRVPDRMAVTRLAGSGGNIEALADAVGQDGSVVKTKALRRFAARLETMTPEERMEAFGWRPDRADVILPACLVYERVATLFGAEEIHVPRAGVKEGLALDLLDQHFDKKGRRHRLRRGIKDATFGLGRAFSFDEDHHVQVTRFALTLFDDLQGLHGLHPKDRRILQTAAMLHDIGKAISDRRHHKHSFYLIENAEIPGLSTKQLRMAAAVARYHRKAMPKPHHHIYQDLEDPDRDRVDRLSAILRVADALDKRHANSVSRVHATVTAEGVRLDVTGSGPYHLQEWAMRTKSDLFERVFGMSVQMIVDAPEPEARP